jgi:hypothetical protein
LSALSCTKRLKERACALVKALRWESAAERSKRFVSPGEFADMMFVGEEKDGKASGKGEI